MCAKNNKNMLKCKKLYKSKDLNIRNNDKHTFKM